MPFLKNEHLFFWGFDSAPWPMPLLRPISPQCCPWGQSMKVTKPWNPPDVFIAGKRSPPPVGVITTPTDNGTGNGSVNPGSTSNTS